MIDFVTVGLSHKTAGLDLREKITVEKENLTMALDAMDEYIDQSVLISTCNRLEVYSYSEEELAASKVLNFLSEYFEVDKEVLQEHLYTMTGSGSVNHLFNVVGGMDSMIVGEHQILGQVRDYYGIASNRGNVSGPLMRLFHRAFRTGRKIRRETNISKYGRSVSKTAATIATDKLDGLQDSSVMVIGAGDAGRLVTRALSYAGADNIIVANRTRERADELADSLGGTSIPYDMINESLSSVDVIISSTGSPGYVITETSARNAIMKRNGKPIVMIDIAVPRDIDPSLSEFSGVHLYSMDDLAEHAGLNDPLFETEILRSNLMIDTETDLFMSWWNSLDTAELVADLYRRSDQVRSQELGKTLKYMINSDSFDINEVNIDELVDRLDAFSQAIVNKLFHSPTSYIKSEHDPLRQDMIRKWFDLNKE